MTNDDRHRFTLRLPTRLMNTLKEDAERQGVPLNALVLKVLWEWVAKNEKKE